MNDVKIPKAKYDELIRNQEELIALEQGGVDNWVGYDDALERLRRDRELKEKREELIGGLLEELSEHIDAPAGWEAGHSICGDEPYDIVERFLTQVTELKEKS